MKISELQVRQGNVDVEAEVKSIEEPRSFERFGRTLRVANAVVDDGSGTIKLTLWNEDIDKIKVGDKVKVTNGYVNEFNGEKQLTSGKFGKLEILGKVENEAEESEESKEEQTRLEEPEESEEKSEEEPEVKEEKIE